MYYGETLQERVAKNDKNQAVIEAVKVEEIPWEMQAELQSRSRAAFWSKHQDQKALIRDDALMKSIDKRHFTRGGNMYGKADSDGRYNIGSKSVDSSADFGHSSGFGAFDDNQ